jgi:sec-independent protein translocase protein TatA
MNTLALFDENMRGILLILLIAILLFGSTKIPQLARSLGRSVSEFKKGVREGEEDEKKPVEQKDSEKKPG